MTNRIFHVIVSKEIKGPQVRKGKAMLQIHTHSFTSINRLYDLQGTNMPSANKAERLISTCLNRAGSSGYLKPGAFTRILE